MTGDAVLAGQQTGRSPDGADPTRTTARRPCSVRDHPIRHLQAVALAVAVAVVAGTAIVLGLSAYLDVRWDPAASVLLALAAVWLPQALIFTRRGIRRRR
ncbi:MAG TPA: hypothetical protein VF082_12760 [Jiangellaceae bacterium]